jgi:hypothetical protein
MNLDPVIRNFLSFLQFFFLVIRVSYFGELLFLGKCFATFSAVLKSHQILQTFKLNFYKHCNEDLIYVFLKMKLRGLIPNFNIHVFVSDLQGASKIKVKSIYEKRLATARRLIFFGVSQGVHC